MSKLTVQIEYPFTWTSDVDSVLRANPIGIKILNSYFYSAVAIDNGIKWVVHRDMTGENATKDVDPKLVSPSDVLKKWWEIVGVNIQASKGVFHEGAVNEFGLWQFPDWIAELELRRMEMLERVGARACIFNFSVGQPDWPAWDNPLIREAMDRAYSQGHLVGLHEYSSPSLNFDSDNLILRHRKIWSKFTRKPNLFLTECGIDQVYGNGKNGWRTCVSGDEYFNQLSNWYSKELDKDSYVIAAAIYDFRSTTKGDDSENYNIKKYSEEHDGLDQKLFDFILTDPRGIVEVPPAPTPQPADVSGEYYVKVDVANIRKTPSTLVARVGYLPRNFRVNVVSISGGWAKLDSGYYVADFLLSKRDII